MTGTVHSYFASSIASPQNMPSPRARSLWRVNALIIWVVFGLFWLGWASVFSRSTAHSVVGAVAIALAFVNVLVAPAVRYRVHRWEIGQDAVFTRSGWLVIERRIAPMSRVQTVDIHRGPTERAFGLATVTVTTASSAGAVRIPALDVDIAQRIAEDLTRRTNQIDSGDGT